jgi:hypothetical protein
MVPLGSLLDLDERRRELMKRHPNPVAGTQPYAFAVTPVVGHNRDGTPGLDAREISNRGPCQTEPSASQFCSAPDTGSAVLPPSLVAGILPPRS